MYKFHKQMLIFCYKIQWYHFAFTEWNHSEINFGPVDQFWNFSKIFIPNGYCEEQIFTFFNPKYMVKGKIWKLQMRLFNSLFDLWEQGDSLIDRYYSEWIFKSVQSTTLAQVFVNDADKYRWWVSLCRTGAKWFYPKMSMILTKSQPPLQPIAT